MKNINFRHPKLLKQNVGSSQWWDEVKASGAPLISAIDNQSSQVCFLWQDPDGKDSNIECVYIDLYSKTPHPTKQLTSFARLENSDVWYWQTVLPNDWLSSYLIMPITKHQSPPVQSDSKAIRQWWIKSMGQHSQTDSLNPLPSYSTSNGTHLSTLCLRNDKETLFQHINAQPNGILTQSQWHSETLENERSIWLYRTSLNATATLPVVLLFDGQYWAESLAIYGDLDALTNAGKLPAAQYVFIDSIDTSHRSNEMPCNELFWLSLKEDLLPWVNAQYPISDNAQQRVIAGQSFGGLCAIYGAFHWPEFFANAISLSGSFWWPDFDSSPGDGELIQTIKKSQKDSSLNVVMEAGSYENDMLEISQIMAATLKSKGHSVSFNEFRGGHDWLCWRERLLRSLEKIFKS